MEFSIFKILYSSQAFLLVIAAIFLHIVKNKKALLFCLITLAFFIWAISLDRFIKDFDSPRHFYRYIFWAFNDIVWMGLIAYLTIKDKIHLWQSIAGQLLVLPAPLLQLIRLVDLHYFDLIYTDFLYQTFLPLINTFTVALCFLPLSASFIQYVKNRPVSKEINS